MSDLTPEDYLAYRLKQAGLSDDELQSVVHDVSAKWAAVQRANTTISDNVIDMPHNAIIVTRVEDLDDPICDHGCSHAVHMLNITDDQEWVICLLSFERTVERSLRVIDCHARGVLERCHKCPLG